MTTGEGGMVLGREASLMARVRTLREYDKRDTLESAFNYKMTDLQAAVGLRQLHDLPAFIARRRAIASRYSAALHDLKVEPPGNRPNGGHVYYRYVIRVSEPVESVVRRFAGQGVMCRRPVFRPLHRYLGLDGFPETDQAWEHTLSVPIYPSLTDAEVERVVGAMKAVLA
jgi:dTDP-4-amino-4,6-dideoxygalactose transaminase